MGIQWGRHKNTYNVENPPKRKEIRQFLLLNEMINFSSVLTATKIRQIEHFIKRHSLTRELFLSLSWLEDIPYPPVVAAQSCEPEVLDILCCLGFLLPDPAIPSSSSILPSVCVRGEVIMVRKLVEDYGFDVNETDRTNVSLFLACMHQHADVVQFLVEEGAWLNVPDSNHKSILHIVGKSISSELYAFLISHGADVNATDCDGNTPLHYAALQTSAALVNILLQHGAKVNIKNKAGQTPLVYSVSWLKTYWVIQPIDAENIYKNVRNITIIMLDAGCVICENDFDSMDVYGGTSGATIIRRIKELVSLRSNPRSLQELSIFSIRDSLSVNFLTAVERLPIPTKLKDFVKLKHVVSIWNRT